MKQSVFLLIIYLTWLTACQPSQQSSVEAWAFQSTPHGSWGLMSPDGTVKVPAGTYDYPPTAVVNGLFAVPDSVGFYTLYQQDQPTCPVNNRRFSSLGYFFEEVAPAQELPDSPLLLIDRFGNTRFTSDTDSPYPIAYLYNFSEGRALAVTTQGEYGYLDTNGQWIIPPIYQRAYHFHEGLALVGMTNTQGQMGYLLIDRHGKPVMTIQKHPIWLDEGFHDGLLLIKNLKTNQFYYLDQTGKDAFYLPYEVTEATAYRYGMAAVQTAQGWGVIDRKGNFCLPPNFQHILLNDPQHIWAQKNGKWALYTPKGKALTAFVFDSPDKYRAQKYSVNQIIVDEAAYQEKPQCFWRKHPVQELQEADTLNKQTILPVKTSPEIIQKSIQTPLSRSPKTTLLPEQNWQQVSQKNPFYQEAQKILSGKLQESDAKRRRMILNYVEHFRTAYTTKDIDFLGQVFSDRALIIVGKVIKSSQQPESQFLKPQQVVYQVKTKRQYLDRLKQVFQANQDIHLSFSNFKIMRHPTHPDIYGVSLRQGYASDLYADDGYLFLLWDFSDETAPKIHVRTWQPSMIDEHTPLPEEAILNISHFNLK